MKKWYQKLFSIMLVAAMILAMAPAVKVTAATGTVWTGGSFSASGSYYLTGDVTITEAITIGSGKDIKLDLNGHTIHVAEGVRGFYLNQGKLTIQDSGTDGAIKASETVFDGRGGIIYVKGSSAVLTLEGGTLSGGKASERGGNIYVEAGKFNMTGGTVTGGYAGDRGGNIASTATLNISGGTISDGEASGYGGNIVSTGASCPINLSGAAVISGGSSKNGGNISLMYSTFNMTGGSLLNGTATAHGGNIHTYGNTTTSSTVRISGGTVEVAATDEESIFLNGGTNSGCLVEISGGTLGGTINATQIGSITLSGAPVVEHLELEDGIVVTPAALTEGASIGVSSVSGYASVTGILTDAAAYLPYFTAYKAGYGIGVKDNTLALVPECVCGCGTAPENVQWTELTGYTGGALTTGHYYVPAEGLTLTSQFSVAAGQEVTLDLRGSTLSAPAAGRAFYVYGKLSVMDSSEEGTGKLVGGTLTGSSAYGGTIYLDTNGQFYLYSGTVTGGTADRGGNLYMAKASNVVVISGGAITDGTATASSSTTGRGGNIYQISGALTITGNAVISGGNAQRWVPGEGHSGSNNSARGGNIFATGGTCVISGNAQLQNGVSGQYGGNAMFYTCEAEISGNAQIIGGDAVKYGNNLVTMNAQIAILGNAYVDAGSGDSSTSIYCNDTGSGESIVNTVTLGGGILEGQIAVIKAKELVLTGSPKTEYLYIYAGMLATSVSLTEGAEVTLRATDGTFTGVLEDADTQAAYFKAYQTGYAVSNVDGCLTYGTACPCGCGQVESNVTWKSWSGSAVTASGHYILTGNKTLSAVNTVAAGVEMILDLNGNTLTAPDSDRAFWVQGSLTILDSGSGGKLTGGNTTEDGGNIYVAEGAQLCLRSGTITAGKTGNHGGNIQLARKSSFYMYGGTVSNGSADERGGNIYVGEDATFYMYGGTISNGTAVKRGGNLFVNHGITYMTAGTLSGGTTTYTSANTYGGNVMVTGEDGEFHMSGTAKLTAGVADNGSTVSLMYGNLYVSGGTITSGTIHATGSGGNYSGLYISDGTVNCSAINMYGDIDEGNAGVAAITGGTINCNLNVTSASSMILSGAPSIQSLTLGETARITPTNLAEDVVIPLNATGPFTTKLTNADSYIQNFDPSAGYIVNENGVLSVYNESASGTSGSISWALNADGTLHLTGSGAMTNYASTSAVPWADYVDAITKVIVGEGITTIGRYSFYGCGNLTEVELAETVTTIGVSAFRNCSQLQQITLPAGLTTVRDSAFRGSGLTQILLPEPVTSLGECSFYGCSALTHIDMGSSVATIDTNAFYNCSSLDTVYYAGTTNQWNSITINSGNGALTGASITYGYVDSFTASAISWSITGSTLKVSGSGEMPGYYRNTAHSNLVGSPWSAYADQITKVVISGFTSVGEWAFYDLHKLTSVTFGSGTTKIEANAFRECDALTSLTIPSTVKTIGDNAFFGCDKLTTVTLSSKLTTIGSYAFYDCAALTGITIPAAVTTIGKNAFDGCTAMTAITVASGNANYISANGALLDYGGLTLLRVPGGYTGSYTVPSTVGTIAENAFANCKGITDVVISDNVTTIEAGAFFGSSVTTVTLGAGVTTIANTAFNDCGDMTAFVCQNNETFSVDTTGALCSVTEDSVTLLQVPGGIAGEYAMDNSVVTVSTNALAWNSSITRLKLSNHMTTAERYAFAGTEFTQLDMTTTTDAFYKGAFESAGLTTVNYLGTQTKWDAVEISSYNEPLLNATVNLITGGILTDTITWEVDASGVLTIKGTGEIPAYAEGMAPWYSHSGGITSVQLGEGITAIGADAFYACDLITQVSLPLTLTTVSENAFADCSALTAVTYAGTEYQWTAVTVASGNTKLAEAAFTYAEAVLTEISVKTLPTKLEYRIGDTVDTTGIVLLLTYHDGSTKEVSQLTEDYQVTGDLTTSGTVIVTITYQELTASYPVEVAATGSCGENVTWVLLDGVLTLSGTGEMTYYGAKEEVPWWNMKDAITSIVVEEGITGRISRFAFYQCVNMETISLPEGITSLGSSALYGCSSLKEVVIPSTVTGMSSTVFGNNTSLTTVSFGENMTSVGEGAFKNCTSLTTVNYGGSRTTWAEISINATDNSYLTGATINYARLDPVAISVSKLPDKVKYVVGETLDTTGLELTVTYDDDSQQVYTGEFSATCELSAIGAATATVTAGDFTATFQVEVLPGGVTEDGVVWYIDGTELSIHCEGAMPDYSQENLPPWATASFAYTNVTFSDTVTSIGAYALAGGTAVTQVQIPYSVEAVADNAFADCSALETVNYGGNSITWNWITVGQNNDALLNAAVTYAMAEPTGITVTKLPNKAEYLLWESFDATGMELAYVCEDGETMAVREAFTATCAFSAIGEATVNVTLGAFTTTCAVTVLPSGYCSDDGESLRWSLVDGVLTISGTGEMTYYGSRDLVPWWDYKSAVTSAVVEEGVTGRLSRFALYQCVNMETVSLPEGITFLGSSALYGCSSLKEIVIPSTVTGISSTVFGGNTSLTTVSFGEKLGSVGEGAFKNCTSLTTVNYGGSRTTWAEISINATDNSYLTGATINYARVDATSLEITQQPTKLAYLQGEILETEGMEVTIHWDDGTSQAVTDYTATADMNAIGVVPVTVSYAGKTAEYSISIGYGGYTEDGLFWQYADGVLTVDYVVNEENPGTGIMLDYTAETPAPWAVIAAEVESLVVGDGVTVLGTYAFAECTAMTTVVLPATLTEIRENAFLNCSALTTVNYTGEEDSWNDMQIAETGNETLLEVKPKVEILLGDVNGDGSVDFMDVGDMQAYLSGKITLNNPAAGDLNGDGDICFLDLGALQAYMAGK